MAFMASRMFSPHEDNHHLGITSQLLLSLVLLHAPRHKMMMNRTLRAGLRTRVGVMQSRWMSGGAVPSREAVGEEIGEFENIRAERKGKVGLITMTRPPVNAVSDGLLHDIIDACVKFGECCV